MNNKEWRPSDNPCPKCGKMTLDYGRNGFRCLRVVCKWEGQLPMIVKKGQPNNWRVILDEIVGAWCKARGCDDAESWVSCDCENRDDFIDGATAMLKALIKYLWEPCTEHPYSIIGSGNRIGVYHHRSDCPSCMRQLKESE